MESFIDELAAAAGRDPLAFRLAPRDDPRAIAVEMVLVNNRPEYPSYGAGEPSTNPTAAAVSNAVFDATGVRLRQTPFRPERVKASMS